MTRVCVGWLGVGDAGVVLFFSGYNFFFRKGGEGLRILTNVCMWVVDTIRDGVALKNTQRFSQWM